jgi:HSP20 family molecular chaperone IbpA
MPAHNPELIAVHLLPEDIHPAQTAVDAVDGVLQVHLPKQRNKKKK